MSEDEIVPVSVGGVQESNADASDGDQHSTRRRVEESSSSSSSSSEDEEGIASPPPNKRRKLTRKYKQVQTCSDPRVETLVQQVGFISSYLTNLPLLASNSGLLMPEQQQNDPTPSTSNYNYLKNPSTSDNHNLSLGVLGIEIDVRTVIPQADRYRLQELNNLQKFESPSWKGIRYKSALQSCIANPGFVGLKLNEELCHFNRNKDYLASTEHLLAGLSNNILEQRQLLRSGLQDLLEWVAANSNNLNTNTLYEKISSIFGPGSPTYKNSETAMQIVCGKRAECIEVRRDRILREVTNPNLKATLQGVPPSQEYLFSRATLQPIIASLGGSQVWLNTPAYIKEKRAFNSSYVQNKKHHGSYKTQKRGNKLDRKQNPKFRKNQPFRKNFATNNTSPNNRSKD